MIEEDDISMSKYYRDWLIQLPFTLEDSRKTNFIIAIRFFLVNYCQVMAGG
jgi:hypothetical protein